MICENHQSIGFLKKRESLEKLATGAGVQGQVLNPNAHTT
jgi:hypothetical protein